MESLKGSQAPSWGRTKKILLRKKKGLLNKKLFSVTEEDVEDVLPLEVREKLKGSQAPSQGLYKKEK